MSKDKPSHHAPKSMHQDAADSTTMQPDEFTSQEDGAPQASDMAQQQENLSAPISVAELMQIQGETDRFKDMALRAQADFENYRKRAAREKEDSIRFANLGLLERLLPILDNFELGLVAAKNALEKDAGKDNATAAALVNGMSMVQKQIEDFLRDQGVEPIDALGKPFDPHLHEALGHQTCDKTPEGHVVQELRRGYKLRDRLLRPSNVFVATPPTAETE